MVGYDPGGSSCYGLATLRVLEVSGRWRAHSLAITTAATVGDAVSLVRSNCAEARILALGLDTLTEWSAGLSGWRPADRWLRQMYPSVASSVISPNYISGSMAVNGAAFLVLLSERLRADGTMVTEAHPKVCFFAQTGERHNWKDHKDAMIMWLMGELGLGSQTIAFGGEDHCFDAAIAALAALRGVNGEWSLDLHALPLANPEHRISPIGPTHYWWPSERFAVAKRD